VAELSISGTLDLPADEDPQRFRVHALRALFGEI